MGKVCDRGMKVEAAAFGRRIGEEFEFWDRGISVSPCWIFARISIDVDRVVVSVEVTAAVFKL